MIVSLRSPTRPDSASPKAGANGEAGSTHAPLSAPVMRKFFAVGSAGGNVSGRRRLDSRLGRRRRPVPPAADVGAGPSVATGVSGAGCSRSAGLEISTTSRLRTTM